MCFVVILTILLWVNSVVRLDLNCELALFAGMWVVSKF